MALKFRSVVAAANAKLPVSVAAIVLSASTLIAALLGIFRDRLLNGLYLDTYPTGIDAYTVAFTIPDFMFFILVSGALSVTFIPVFNQRLASGNKKSAWELSSSILNLLALVTIAASILIIIFAEPLVKYVVGPGLDESARALAVSMMRVIAINPFLFAIATVLSSIQQAVGRFVFYAMAPAVYNICIIIGIVWFTGGINIFGWQVFEGGIMGVALGVALGSVLQLVISVVGLLGLGFDYEFKIRWKNLGFRRVLKLLPARSADQGIDYVSSIVQTNLASRMAPGTVRSFQQALSLHMMPINLIGVAISTAFFPKMTEALAQGDQVAFKKDLVKALRMILLFATPVAVIAFFTRGYIANFIKNGGDFLIAGLLGALVLSILCRCLFHIAARGFYADQDTRTPLIISVVSIGLNILLAIAFTTLPDWGGTNPAYGLAYAESIGALVEIVLLVVVLSKKFGKFLRPDFWRTTARIVIASAVAGVAAFAMTKLLPLRATNQSFFSTFPKFGVIAAVSLLIYLAVCRLLRVAEIEPLVAKAKAFLFGWVKQKR